MACSTEIFRNSTEGRKMVGAMSKFALDLYSKLANKDPDGNIFMSPASISIALTMTYMGTEGSTREEMKLGMNFSDLDEDHIHSSVEDLAKSLQNTDGSYQLHIANRLYGKEGFKIINTFLEATKLFYGIELQALDFRADPEGSAKVINDWVEDQTNKQIKDLIPASALGPLTALVLVNAIYFMGNWASPFWPSLTTETDFQLIENGTVKVPMMTQTAYFNLGYNQNLDTEVLELPYIGEKLSMFILLPQKSEGLVTLESKLTTDHLINMQTQFQMRETYIDVYLPRFKLEDSFDLEKTLPLLGLRELFDKVNANLSRIGAANNLYVSKVVHKAFIEVNEEGSEAGAATGVSWGLCCLPPQFMCDHPFLFLIRDNITGAFLFLGRLTNPVPQ